MSASLTSCSASRSWSRTTCWLRIYSSTPQASDSSLGRGVISRHGWLRLYDGSGMDRDWQNRSQLSWAEWGTSTSHATKMELSTGS